MIRTASKARQPGGHEDFTRPMSISLRKEPFAIPDGPDETAPTMPTIRGKGNWQKDRTLRHAERIAR